MDNATANATAANATAANATEAAGAANSTAAGLNAFVLLGADLYSFALRAPTDPLGAVKEHPHLTVLLVLAITAPILFSLLNRALSAKPSVDLALAGTVEEEAEDLAEEAKAAPTTDAIWQIGVSSRSASVAEEGAVRLVAFTKDLRPPTAKHIVATLVKAMVRPEFMGDLEIQRPKLAIFLPSRTCSDAVVAQVAATMKERFDMRVVSAEQIASEMPEIQKRRQAQIAEAQRKANAGAPLPVPGIKNPNIKLQAQPNRHCFNCKKEIETKPSQCSACKAVIYCSGECSKKSWPEHKMLCAGFKRQMSHVEEYKLHSFPFSFYTAKAPLANYNLVPYLNQQGYHNIGVFRRLCGCYNQVPCGEIGAQTLAEIQQENASAQRKFEYMGLPQELYPLAKPLPADVDVSSIDSWESLFKARGWQLDSPAAFVLDIPMTVWFLANKFALKNNPAPADDKPREITIHLIGVEIEADYVQLFEALLPMFPNTHVALHMIGPAISKRIQPQHRTLALRSEASKASLFMTLNSDFYREKYVDGTGFPDKPPVPEQFHKLFNFGTGKPDLVIALNANVLSDPNWRECIEMLVKRKARVVFTDQIEHMGELLGQNLPHLGSSLTVKPQANPFRQPVFQFKPDINLPAFSNGFYYGMGPL
ncbi:hypothetical protein HK105_201411 [Polyrhizophydium stewartii]|uniref:MYND-type domain-containing protein n=1 Tax=Polyrhizophydium stewartii TaxID=2732419 RepID=A0ABR4NHX9_9FUNG|nr:hypothetical protein HK105_000199 [Polyrhizophydium stewartii]